MNKNINQPNIILITADSLRSDFLGCYGSKKGLSENIDELASESLVFDNAITPGTPTFFAFPSIMCGIKPFQFGRQIGVPSPDKAKTIAEVMKSNGYNTYAVVSDNPVLYGEVFGYNRGFDYYLDYNKKQDSQKKKLLANLPKCILSDNTKKKIKGKIYSAKDSLKYTMGNGPATKADKINEEAKKLIKKNEKNKPFFMWLHYMDTHNPYTSGSELFDLYGGKHLIKSFLAKFRVYSKLRTLIKNSRVDNKKDLEIIIAMYESSLKFFDIEIGKLFKQIKDMENTYIIFTADHGEGFMEHNYFHHAPHILYNEMIKIPLIIYGPKIKADNMDQIASLINIPKTICALAGIKNEEFKGFDLTDIKNTDLNKYLTRNNITKLLCNCRFLKLLRNDSSQYEMLGSVITNKYKYISNEEKDKEELYNLKNDSLEKDNIVNDNKDIVENFRKILW